MKNVISLVISLALMQLFGCQADTASTSRASPGSSAPSQSVIQSAPLQKEILIGVNYFSGWWEETPNKWQDPETGKDWTQVYPRRLPELGMYNSQSTLDAEIQSASTHGIDFFSFLWFYHPPGMEAKLHNEHANDGLKLMLTSPNAYQLHFMIELCNHKPFVIKTDAEWNQCVKNWLSAFAHPSYLRVGGRLVFKIHSAEQFLDDCGADATTARRRIDELRTAVREKGLGEMIVGGGILADEALSQTSEIEKVFDFTNTYMTVPHVPVKSTDYPYSELDASVRKWRMSHRNDPKPYVPFLPVGWNPRPWHEPKACFTFPTGEEWSQALSSMKNDLESSDKLGFPLPNGKVQRAFTIYAWNEFGEGGILAPTRADGDAKLELVQRIFRNP